MVGADGSAVPSPHRATGGPGGTEHVHDQAAGHDAGDAIGAVVARRYLYDIHAHYAVFASNSSQHRSELAVQDSSGTWRHDRGHFRRVETVGVDRDIDRAAVGNRG